MLNGDSKAGEAWFWSAFLTAVVVSERVAAGPRAAARKSALEEAARTIVFVWEMKRESRGDGEVAK